MAGYSSPLLDQYNKDGIITPGLQRAMDIAKQKLAPGIGQLPGQPGPLGQQPGPQPMSVLGQPVAQQPQQRPVSVLGQPVGQSTPAAPKPLTGPPSPHEAEYARLTAPPRQTGDPLQHTQQDTGVSGIDQIHNSWLRTPLKILGAIEAGFAPGLAMATPGTDLHHELLVRRQENQLNEEQKRGLESAQETEAGARTYTALHPKATNDFEAWSAQNPNSPVSDWLKLQSGSKEPTTAFSDWRRQNPNAPAEEWLKLQESVKPKPPNEYGDFKEGYAKEHPNATPDEIVQAFAKDRQAPARTPQNEYEDFKTGYISKHPQADTFEIAREYAKAHQSPERPPRTMVFEPDGNGGYTSRVIEGSGEHVAGGAMNASGMNTMSVPTQQQRNASERSETMMDIDARIRKALQNPELRKGTGPLAGRLSEIQNRLGTLPHDLSELKNDLVSYGAFQAGLHPVRGIGGIEYFDKVMGGLGQTPEELLGKLDSNKATAESVQRVAGKRGGTNGGGANSIAVGTVEDGYRFKGGDPKLQSSWEKVK